MASKKNFDNINSVFATVTEATAEQPAEKKKQGKQITTPAETLQAVKENKTARLNLVITPSNYAYLKVLSQVRGQSVNEFVNNLIEKSREQNAETYEKALEFLKAL